MEHAGITKQANDWKVTQEVTGTLPKLMILRNAENVLRNFPFV